MRGNLVWEVFIGLVLIALIGLSMFITASSADSEAIQNSILVKNLGLSLSLSSFIPGNVQYVSTLEQDGNLYKWSEKVRDIRLTQNKIQFGEKYSEEYPFYLNHLFPDYSARLSPNSFNISKSFEFSTDYNKELSCSSNKKFKLYRVKGPEGFYSSGGTISESDDLNFVGFDIEYFFNGERVYTSPKSSKVGNYYEYEILEDVGKDSGLEQIYYSGYVIPSESSDVVFVDVSISSENMVKIYTPKNLMNSSCELYNQFVNNFKTSLIPYDSEKILVVFSGDESFFTSSNLRSFSKSLEVLNG